MKKGDRIGPVYEVLEQIGSGSQGEVFKVKTAGRRMVFALKLLSLGDKSAEERQTLSDNLTAEFKIIRGLNHENIVKVIDFGFDEKLGKYYYVMEYLKGENLAEFFKNKFSEESFTEITYQILKGLAFLHSNDIIHFDIKPDNIIVSVLENGSYLVKILDFGLSELNKDDRLGDLFANRLKGTLTYLAPEVILEPALISEKIDLYSLGIALIHSLQNKGCLFSDYQIISKSKESLFEMADMLIKQNRELLKNIASSKVREFIALLIEPNPELRISSATVAISSLNFLFQKQYEVPINAKISNFFGNSRFILRENIVEELEEAYYSFTRGDEEAGENNPNVISLIGEHGSGKTKILDKVYYDLVLKSDHAVAFKMVEKNNRDLKIAIPFLNYIYSFYGKPQELAQEYEKLIEDIEISKKSNIDINLDRINQRVIAFVNRIAAKPILVLFDSYEKFNHKSMIFIQQIVEGTKNNHNLFYIFAISSESFFQNTKNNIKHLLNRPNTKLIEVENLNKEDLQKIHEELIGKIMSLPKRYFEDILEYSYGNFGKVMSFIDAFFNEKVIKALVDGYVFTDYKLFQEILRRDSKAILNKEIELLEEKEVKVASLLSLAKKLTAKGVADILEESLYDTEKTLEKLKSKNIIKRYALGNSTEFRVVRGEVKDAFIECLTEPQIRFYCEKLVTLRSKNKFEEEVCNLLNIILGNGQKYNLEEIEDILKQMEKYDEDNQLVYILKMITSLVDDMDLKFFFVLKRIKILKERNSEEARELIKSINSKILSKIKNESFKIDFILFKLFSFDIHLFNFDLVKYFNKYSKYLYEQLGREEFYSKMIDIIEIYPEKHPNKLNKLKKVIKKLKGMLNNEKKNISPEFIMCLKIKEKEYRLMPCKDRYLTGLQNDMKIFEEKKIINDNYFKYLISFFRICNQHLYFNEFVKKKLEDSIELASKLGKNEYLVELLDSTGDLYFSFRNYKKSFSYSEKILELHSKTRVDISRLNIWGTLVTNKFSLYYPYGEIQTLLKTLKSFGPEKVEAFIYFQNLINEVNIHYKFGKFIAAEETLIELLDFFENISEYMILFLIKSVSSYFPTFLKKEYLYYLVGKQFLNNSIKTSTTRKIFARIEEIYKYKIPYRWSPANYDNVLNGTLKEETPAVLMAYIKKHKELPAVNKVMQTIPENFNDPDCLAEILSLKVTCYMLTKKDDFLKEIEIFAKKLFMRGYLIQLYFLLVPLVEFMVMMKTEGPHLVLFLSFLTRIDNMIELNSSKSHYQVWQESVFAQNFYRAKKRYEDESLW